jgi:hypothetical protein
MSFSAPYTGTFATHHVSSSDSKTVIFGLDPKIYSVSKANRKGSDIPNICPLNCRDPRIKSEDDKKKREDNKEESEHDKEKRNNDES